MHSPILHRLLAEARIEDFRRAARRHQPPPALPGRARLAPAEPSVTLRFGFPDDANALARLAALDSSEPPAQPVLLAEVEGELRAAMSLADGTVVADPFRHTVALIELLRARATQLQSEAGRSSLTPFSPRLRWRPWPRVGG